MKKSRLIIVFIVFILLISLAIGTYVFAKTSNSVVTSGEDYGTVPSGDVGPISVEGGDPDQNNVDAVRQKNQNRAINSLMDPNAINDVNSAIAGNVSGTLSSGDKERYNKIFNLNGINFNTSLPTISGDGADPSSGPRAVIDMSDEALIASTVKEFKDGNAKIKTHERITVKPQYVDSSKKDAIIDKIVEIFGYDKNSVKAKFESGAAEETIFDGDEIEKVDKLNNWLFQNLIDIGGTDHPEITTAMNFYYTTRDITFEDIEQDRDINIDLKYFSREALKANLRISYALKRAYYSVSSSITLDEVIDDIVSGRKQVKRYVTLPETDSEGRTVWRTYTIMDVGHIPICKMTEEGIRYIVSNYMLPDMKAGIQKAKEGHKDETGFFNSNEDYSQGIDKGNSAIDLEETVKQRENEREFEEVVDNKVDELKDYLKEKKEAYEEELAENIQQAAQEADEVMSEIEARRMAKEAAEALINEEALEVRARELAEESGLSNVIGYMDEEHLNNKSEAIGNAVDIAVTSKLKEFMDDMYVPSASEIAQMIKNPDYIDPNRYLVDKMQNEIRVNEKNQKITKTDSWEIKAQTAAITYLCNWAGNYVNEFMNTQVNQKLKEKLGNNPIGGLLADTVTDMAGGYIRAVIGNWRNNLIGAVKDAALPSDKEVVQEVLGDFVSKTEEAMIGEATADTIKSIKTQSSYLTRQWIAIRDKAYAKLADSTGKLAEQYVNQLFSNLMDKVKFFDDSNVGGRALNSFTQAVVRQIRNYVGDNIKNNLTTWLRNNLLGENGTIKWEGLHMDWKQVGVETLAGLLGNEEIAEAVNAGYRAYKAMKATINANFEDYSEMNYLFAISGGKHEEIIPSKLFITGAAIGGLATGGIVKEQYHHLYDSFLIYNGQIWDTSKYNGISPMSSLYITWGWLKSFVNETQSCSQAYLYGASTPKYVGTIHPGLPANYIDAYILCEMQDNKQATSSVQTALSLSGQLGGIYKGTPIISMNLPKAIELLQEGLEFSMFTYTNLFAGGFDGTVEDLTEKTVAMYNRKIGRYIIGPFKVDYNRSSVKTSRGKSEFGLMTGAHIFDQNGREIPRGYWRFVWEEGEKKRKIFYKYG